MLKWITFGLFGRSQKQGVLRNIYAMFYPPVFLRGSREATMKVVQKFFPENEQDYVVRQFHSKRGYLMFDSEQRAEKFFKSLEKVGWNPEMETDILDTEHPCFFYVPDERYLSTADVEGMYWNPKLGTIVGSFGVYSRGKKFFEDYNDTEVFLFDDLKPKEVEKYVAKQAA